MTVFDDDDYNKKISSLHTKEEERALEITALRLGLTYIDLHGYTIDPEALSIIPENQARSAEMAGFNLKNNILSLAIKNPNSPNTQTVLSGLQKRYQLVVYMCSTASLEHAWKRYQDIINTKAEKKGIFEIDTVVIRALSQQIKTAGDVTKQLQTISTANTSRRISETLELIFAGGLALGASDIHIEPEPTGVRLRYRFDGVLHDIADLDRYMHERLMSRLKLLSGMVLNTHAEAQDGRFTFNTGEREIEVRSSVIPGAAGESIVMRLLDPTLASFSLERVQLNPYIKQALEHELKKPNGLIITTGPTGSGKTTMLYAFLRQVHTEGVKIITIENPVEYKLEGIVQTQTDEQYTFASGLRAILRQDPDIIMVGEIRDKEVAETAIHAAQTGHLVFSTLHTNNAVAGFARLIDLGVDPRVIGSSINIIIGQRLVRKLCENCKKTYTASPEESDLIKKIMSEHPHPVTIPDPLVLHRAVGCEQCGNTGFHGRIAIFEGVMVDEAVEEVVLRDPREHLILEAAKPQGIPTMVQDGIEKVIQGNTSLSELERVVELPYHQSSQNGQPQNEEFLKHVV